MTEKKLAGKTVLLSGGSRGIGLAIALRCAADGANIAILAKTDTPHPKLEGTVHTAAEAIEAADTLVIGLPIYNFAVPSAFKAWVDLVARAGVTFRYTENGPEGLLKGKRAILAVASGGTEVGSDHDFATGYARHMLGFMGITDVSVVAADRLMIDPDASHKTANDQIENLAA